jgi:hypothetical protein
MGSSPAPWETTVSTSTTDIAAPAQVFFYVVRATDGTSESAD